MQQWKFGDRLWCSALIAGAGLFVLSCGPDLGECDMTKLGGTNTDPHAGQKLVHSSCAGGRCHSLDAKGDLRVGAPAELDFDVVPADMSPAQIAKVRDGAENVHDHREAMWDAIEGGSMPPPLPEGSAPLTSENKETIRNWLACGAEVIATPGTTPIGGASWTDIYEALVGPGATACTTCHGAAPATIGDGFVLGMPGDACGAYARVVNVDAKTDDGMPPCLGKGKLVVPNDPTNSILLRKIEGGMQLCGSPMPLGNMNGLGATNAIVMNMRAWIMAGAPKPTTCP